MTINLCDVNTIWDILAWSVPAGLFGVGIGGAIAFYIGNKFGYANGYDDGINKGESCQK